MINLHIDAYVSPDSQTVSGHIQILFSFVIYLCKKREGKVTF